MLLLPAIEALNAQKKFTFENSKRVFHNPRTNLPWETDHQIRRTAWIASQMGHVDTEMVMRTYGKWIPDDSSKKGYQPVNNWDAYMNGRKEK